MSGEREVAISAEGFTLHLGECIADMLKHDSSPIVILADLAPDGLPRVKLLRLPAAVEELAEGWGQWTWRDKGVSA